MTKARAAKKVRRWSKHVMETSEALDSEAGIFRSGAEATGNDFLEHLRDEINRSCG